jgi:hypothetical protein
MQVYRIMQTVGFTAPPLFNHIGRVYRKHTAAFSIHPGVIFQIGVEPAVVSADSRRRIGAVLRRDSRRPGISLKNDEFPEPIADQRVIGGKVGFPGIRFFFQILDEGYRPRSANDFDPGLRYIASASGKLVKLRLLHD